jgi:DNA repair protein RadC
MAVRPNDLKRPAGPVDQPRICLNIGRFEESLARKDQCDMAEHQSTRQSGISHRIVRLAELETGRGNGARITELPLTERPRERLSAVGVAHLSDRELLAIVLGTGIRGVGAHVLAEQLLTTYGSILDLARAHHTDLTAIPGMGQAKSCAVVSMFELARRLPKRKPTPRPRLTSTQDLHAIVNPLLTGRTRERLVLLVCNASHRVIHCEVVVEGMAERATVPIREILTTVLRRDGHGFALAHNHPGGDPQPSQADIEVTQQLRFAAAEIGLRFLDHIVVTDHTWRRVNVPGGSWPA